MDPDIVEVVRRYTCIVVPVNYSLCPEDVPNPNGNPYFTMRVTRETRYYEVPHMLLNSHKSHAITVPIRRISENRISVLTDTVLSAFDIPEPDHHSMATNILDVAGNMLNNTHKNDKILNMIVVIGVYICYYDNDNYNPAVGASMEEHQHHNNGLVPASDSAIEALQRVELEQVEGLPHCVICLGVFKVGRGIIRMPCSHFFHRDCIVLWLHRKNDCPLCRFQMPTSQ